MGPDSVEPRRERTVHPAINFNTRHSSEPVLVDLPNGVVALREILIGVDQPTGVVDLMVGIHEESIVPVLGVIRTDAERNDVLIGQLAFD